MNDIFGKICSIFLAVCILFGMPLIYMNERAKTAEQLYLLTTATHFVDSVCNTGRISEQMLRSLYASLSERSSVYEVELLHEQPAYVMDEVSGDYVCCENYYDQEDVWRGVEQDGAYLFDRGDFLVLTVARKAGTGMFTARYDRTVSVRYGGTVKYEAY